MTGSKPPAPAAERAAAAGRLPAGRRTAAEAIAALAVVLHRRTLQEQMTVRVLADSEALLSADFSADPDFTTVRAAAERALASCAVTASAQPGRQLVGDGQAPDAVVVLGAAPAGEGPVPVLAISADEIRLTVPPGERAGLADEIAEQMAKALSDAAAHPHRPVSCLRLASRRALRQVDGWAGSGVASAAPRAVHLLVADQVRRAPHAIAISHAGTEYTYADLDRWANRLAARLIAAGAGPERIVAVLAERSPALVAALLAVLKTGAAYAAFEPDLPPDRLARQLADIPAPLALADDALAHLLPPGIVTVPLPRRDDGAADPGAAASIGHQAHPDALAYVSFTSGSTGEPKGACVPHRAVSRLVRQPDWADFRPDDVFLQMSPVAFDASTLEIWAPLTTGGRLAIHPAGPVSTSQLADTLVQDKVTVAWLTAGLFDRMVRDHLDAFADLRHVLAGGDVVPADRVRQLLAAHPGLVFSNGYGPTENTTFTTVWTTTQPCAGTSVPLGRPIAGTRVRILDPLLAPVPAGVPGELYAGGDGLARCYLASPGSTADRFVPDPRPARPGDRLYRTGDLARWMPDGTVDFLGRTDFQVKISGYRVEPGDVEAALLRQPAVRQAVVVVQSGSGRGQRIVAYVTASDPAGDGLGPVLREKLRSELPPYLVPAAVLLLPELPLTRNGKVDRAALPAARLMPRSLRSEYTPPRTRVEAILAQEWSDLLGVEPVGVDDDFFELGGHSLIAAELLTRLQSRFAVNVSARTLYLRPTVAELAETLPAIDDSHQKTLT